MLREENMETDSLSKKAYYKYVERNPDIIEKYKRYMITDKQKKYIMFLCRKVGKNIPKDLDLMNKMDASKLIDIFFLIYDRIHSFSLGLAIDLRTTSNPPLSVSL